MRAILSISILLLSCCGIAIGTSTLFNGQQADFFPTDTPTSCLASFNTSLNCDEKVQLLTQQTDWVGWNASDLTTLCTAACDASLASLKSIAASACGSWAATVGGATMDASTLLDAISYHYSLACMQDGTTFCHSQLYNWDIPAMIAAGQATWPSHTQKQYYDWENDPISGTLPLDENGTAIQPYRDPTISPAWEPYEGLPPAALDYEYTGGPRPSPNLNWTGPALEYDEFPLEIQCSKCFLDRFKLGFIYPWGETYDEVTAQIWSNIQSNCGFTAELAINPALNQSGPPDPNRPTIIWTAPQSCEQNITLNTPPGQITNCTTLAQTYNIPSGSIVQLNLVNCGNIGNGTICAPLSCQITTVTEGPMSGTILLQKPEYQNLTLVQLALWNPDTDLSDLALGETLCVGPPGGAFIPAATTVALASPTVYTTTATPLDPTPTGTIPNCGIYHNVTAGDYCNMLALNYSITFDQLIAMNPDLDSSCSNLLLGFDYCVGLVNGTTAPPLTSTKTASSTSTTTASNGVTTPTPTQAGMTSSCKTFYEVAPGDTCGNTATKYGIMLADFYSWNPGVGSSCQSLWGGYYVCVGIIGGTSTTTTTTPSTTSSGGVTTPTPYQPDMVAGCKTFHQAVSGDYCYLIATNFGLTTQTFWQWNPDTGTSVDTCSVWLGYFYCVGK